MAPPRNPDCLCAGTRVMTLRGEVPVETIAVGDRVLTLSGTDSPLKPVTWVGQVTVDLDRHPDPLRAAPVRLRAGAVEPGMPIRDLLLSPDHAVYLADGEGRRVLVPALHLVNGATIVREPPAGRVTYVHVAVATHDILMADGMAVESAPPDADRSAFAPPVLAFAPRGQPRTPLPVPTPPDFSPHGRTGETCAPYLWGTDAIALHTRLLERAETLGYSRTEDPGLIVEIDGVPLAPLSDADGEYVYLLPPDTAAIRLASRTWVPYEENPAGGDTRLLGVALVRVIHDGTELHLGSPAFGHGFLPLEGEGADWWRWSTGPADLTLPMRDDETTLELHLRTGWGRYWQPPPE